MEPAEPGATLGMAAGRGDSADGRGDRQPPVQGLPQTDLAGSGQHEREEPHQVRQGSGGGESRVSEGGGLLVPSGGRQNPTRSRRPDPMC
jgi:hypothetical protein